MNARKSVCLVLRSNLKRRKSSNFLIGISIIVGSSLFSLALGLVTTMQQPFDKVFDRLNASHILLEYDFRSDNEEAIRAWFLKQPEVLRISRPTPYYSCSGPFFFKNQKIDVQVHISEYTADHLFQDKLGIVQGGVITQPGYGEMWLPNYLALRHGVKIGDMVSIPVNSGTYKFRVSATVTDAHFGSGMVNPTRTWVRAGSLPFFAPVSQLSNNYLGVRLRSQADVVNVLERFNEKFNYSGHILQYDLFRTAFMSNYQIIGAILLIFSILALTTALFLTSTAISKNIHDDYRLTGILRALGFTPGGTTIIYLLHYTLLATLFIPVGLALSYILLRLILQSVMRTLGIISFDLPVSSIFTIAFAVLLVLVFLTAVVSGLKTRKIKPADAIRYGSPQKVLQAYWISNILKNKSAFFIIISRIITEDKRRALVSFLINVFTVFIVCFSLNVVTSLKSLKLNKAAWGFENGDIQLSRNTSIALPLTHAQLLEVLQREKNIRSIVTFGYENLTVLSENDHERLNLFGKAYDGDIKPTGLTNISGTHPLNENDIALCIGTSRLVNKKPGDSLLVFIEGQKIKYKVTGVYQDISNMGQGFRLLTKSIEKLNPVFTPDQYNIRLVNVNSAAVFKEHLLRTLAGTITISTNIEDRLEQMGIISNMEFTLLLLSVFFIGILAISVRNDVAVSVRDYYKTFGILKAAGFTPYQLRGLVTGRIMVLSGIAVLVAIPLSLWVGPILMSAATGSFGLVHFPFVINILGTALVGPLFFIGCIVCAWTSSSAASKINPRMLLTD